MPCDTSCLECKGANAGDCLECDEGLYLKNGYCISACGTNYYGCDDTNTCEACDASCAECTGESSSECISCASPYYFDGSSCISTCPDGSYGNKDTRICEECESHFTSCVTCSSSTTCTKCDGDFSLYNGQC